MSLVLKHIAETPAFNLSHEALAALETDLLVVFVSSDNPSELPGDFPEALRSTLSNELAQHAVFKGKLGQTLPFHTQGQLSARWVLVVGVGKQADITTQTLRRAAAAAARYGLNQKLARITYVLPSALLSDDSLSAGTRGITEGALLGCYKYTQMKKTPEGESAHFNIQQFTLACNANVASAVNEGVSAGQFVAQATNTARNLAFASSNVITPSALATLAETVSENSNGRVACKVYNKPEIETLGMGAFLGVAQGSVAEPKLIHLTYTPDGPVQKKVAIVGKGITFDSGGLSLKPAKSMELMKYDMAGAAAAISTMLGIAKLQQLNYRVDVIVPACENMPSGHATKPGDIHTAMDGTTIEINNTDAEGRLILCDALTYAQRECDPDVLINMATLTGACVVALGKDIAGIMGTDNALIETLQKSGDVAGEKYWQLPLDDVYKHALKSDVADLINAGSGGEAGSSTAGMFLKHFIRKGQAWAHLDIAGPAWVTRDNPEVPKGATGFTVRTLLYYLYQFTEI